MCVCECVHVGACLCVCVDRMHLKCVLLWPMHISVHSTLSQYICMRTHKHTCTHSYTHECTHAHIFIPLEDHKPMVLKVNIACVFVGEMAFVYMCVCVCVCVRVCMQMCAHRCTSV